MGIHRLDTGQMSTSVHRFSVSLTGQQQQQQQQVMVVGADEEEQGQAISWRLIQEATMTTNDVDFHMRAIQRGSHGVFMTTLAQQENHHHHRRAPVPVLWVIYLNSNYYTSVFAHGVEYLSTLNVASSCYHGLQIFRDDRGTNNHANSSSNVLSFRSSTQNTTNNNNNNNSDNADVSTTGDDENMARRLNDEDNPDPENSRDETTTTMTLPEGHDELTRRRRRLSNNNALINNHMTLSSASISNLQTVVLNLETSQIFSSSNLRIHTINSQGQVSTFADFEPFDFDDVRWDSKDDDDDDDIDDDKDTNNDNYGDDGTGNDDNNRGNNHDDNRHDSLDTTTIQEHLGNVSLLDRSLLVDHHHDEFRFDI